MNYIKRVSKLEDKFRLLAIIGLAIAVLVLSLMQPHGNHAQPNNQTHQSHHQK